MESSERWVPMHPEAAVRRVVDVLDRHGINTLWVSP